MHGPTSVYLNETTRRQVRAMALQDKRSVSDMMRWLIATEWDRRQRPRTLVDSKPE